MSHPRGEAGAREFDGWCHETIKGPALLPVFGNSVSPESEIIVNICASVLLAVCQNLLSVIIIL